MRGLCVLLWGLIPGMATAQTVEPVPYDALQKRPHLRVDFDTLPEIPEPGHVLNAPLRYPGLWIGQHLSGQTVQGLVRGTERFDQILGLPAMPLTVRPGSADQSLAIASHRGFGSNALFPVGPFGAQRRDGRGEGALAIVFDQPQDSFGLKLHADYADPLGTGPATGTAHFTFYNTQGQHLARIEVALRPGVMPLAWHTTDLIAALTVETTDPGGIAVDDVIIPTSPPMG